VVFSTVKHLGGLRLAEAVDASTTHVICGAPKRTMAVLMGLARGCWILKPEWVCTSLEKGTSSAFYVNARDARALTDGCAPRSDSLQP